MSRPLSPDGPAPEPALEPAPDGADPEAAAINHGPDDEYDETAEAMLAARSQVDVLLRARSISIVIYVDDGNPPADQRSGDPERVIAALDAGQLSIQTLSESDTTKHLVQDETGEPTTAEDLVDRLRLHLEDFATDEIAALTDVLRLKETSAAQANSTILSAEGDKPTDVNPTATDLAALAELRALIPDENTEYKPITLSVWEQEKAAVLASEQPVLILFDRDFSREGRGEDAGEDLLLEAIRTDNDNVYAGMLTHRATSDQAERELVTRIAERGGRDVVEIVVISKQTVIDNPEMFPSKLKGALLARPLHRLRDRLTSKYVEAATGAVGAVRSLDAFTLSELVAAADLEGAHGAHNIIRVAANFLRTSVQRMLWTDPDVSGLLADIRSVHEAGEPRNPLPRTDISKLRRDDRYLGGEFLAELHLPLEPGDIFEKVEPAVALRGARQHPGQRFILLVQACDIAVRSDGRRLGEPLTLTLARLKKTSEAKVRSFDHRLEWYDEVEDGEVWCVQVWDRVQVPVRALEACVFGAEGFAVANTSQKVPSGVTPGWARRFGALQAWTAKQLEQYNELVTPETAAPVRKIFTQHLTGTSDQVVAMKAEIDPTAGKIAFGLRRIGRASNDDARLILANAGSYTARPDRDGSLFPEEPSSSEPN